MLKKTQAALDAGRAFEKQLLALLNQGEKVGPIYQGVRRQCNALEERVKHYAHVGAEAAPPNPKTKAELKADADAAKAVEAAGQ